MNLSISSSVVQEIKEPSELVKLNNDLIYLLIRRFLVDGIDQSIQQLSDKPFSN